MSAVPMPQPQRQRQRIMLLGDVPSPISYFHDKHRPESDAVQQQVLGEGEEGVEYFHRDQLLDRPDLVEVPGRPGHLVSAQDPAALVDA
jgi:hypothetical protein